MTENEPGAGVVEVGSEVLVRSVPGMPTVEPGDDLGELIASALARAKIDLQDGDVLAVVSKIVSRAQDCFVDLATIEPSQTAARLAIEVDKDPRLVELILRESHSISRQTRGALIVRHRLGFICANAGIDASNAARRHAPKGSGPWVLTLPRDPDATAGSLRRNLGDRFRANVGVVITDSWGRPFRRGTMGFSIGTDGLPPLFDRRGTRDRHGRPLETTETATADAVAAAADLVAGQAGESRPVILLRGLRFEPSEESSRVLLRQPDQDLYA